MATEWDVFQMLPGTDAPVYLATLYEAREKSIRVELNGCGSGQFAVNRTSPECTEAILAQGNLVRVRIPEVHTDYIFAFFLETGDFTLISSDEEGGEMLHFAGRGILSYLEYACAWSESYIAGGQDPIAGVWRAYAAGTGNKPGQILRRLIEEFQDPDRPQQPLPHLTIDFDYTNDSTTDPWDSTDATDEFSYQVGEDGLAIAQRLIDTETIRVQMDPDFLLHAYNVDTYGRDLTGDAFGTGVVRFERGVNIATELRRELQPLEVKTHMLAGGEADQYGTAALSDAADRVTKEGFIPTFGTGATALNGAAAAELAARLRKSDTIMFPIANRRTDVTLNPVSVGSTIGPGATSGFYLPGPEGTNGDFWVGDTVRVHTGVGPFDYAEVDAVVEAINITRDDDNAELIVIPELKTLPPPPEACVTELGFFGNQVHNVFVYEVTGIEVQPAVTVSRPHENLGTTPFAAGSMTPTSGKKAIIIAGWVFDEEGLGRSTDYSGIPFTSATLTIDQNAWIDGTTSPVNVGSAPVCVRAHQIIASTSGSYNPTVDGAGSDPADNFGDGNGWAAQAGIWLAKPGETPAIRQTKFGYMGGGGFTSFEMDMDPLEGSVLIAIQSCRNHPGQLSMVDADGALDEISAAPTTGIPGQTGRHRWLRLSWREACADA